MPYHLESSSSIQHSPLSHPPAGRTLRAIALRAHQQAACSEAASSRWRPSAALLAMLRELVLTSATEYPSAEAFAPPSRYGVCEPDEPVLSEQLLCMESDFVELSAVHRELVIEFMKLLRNQPPAESED